MTHRIVYRHRLEYDTKVAGVVLPVVILAGDRAEAVSAAVDTGSTLMAEDAAEFRARKRPILF